jgi:hypothetical protein
MADVVETLKTFLWRCQEDAKMYSLMATTEDEVEAVNYGILARVSTDEADALSAAILAIEERDWMRQVVDAVVEAERRLGWLTGQCFHNGKASEVVGDVYSLLNDAIAAYEEGRGE